MEFKVFYKNHSQHQWGDQVLEEMTRKNKVMRAKSRHEMRQAFRNMTNESEEENDEPQQLQQDANTKQSENSDNKPVSEEEQYRRRLQRLLQFREQKRRMQQEKKIKTKAPFVPFVPKKLVEVTQEPLAEGTARPKKPLSELLDQAMQTVAIGSKTPAPVVKSIKPRVDCWRTEKLTPKATENVPPKILPTEKLKTNPTKSAVKGLKPELKRAKETQQPVQQKPIKTIRHAVTAQTVRPLSQQKKPAFVLKVKHPPLDGKQTGGGGTSAMVTSTVRKHRKPLAFTFEPESEIKKDKGLLNVIKTAELFDGISPIEVESPSVRIPASNGVRHSSPIALRAEGDSIWDPQPVACLSTYDATVVHDTVKLNDSAIMDTKGKNEQQIDGNISDWVPAVVHEIDNDTIVIGDDDDEVFKETEMSDASAFDKLENRNRKPALNESFTISVDTAPSNGRPAIVYHEQTVPPLLHMVTNNGNNATSLTSLSVIEINSSHSMEQDRSSSSLPKEKGLNGSKAKKRISWSFTEKPLNSEIEQTAQPTEQCLPEQSELDGSKTKKRASLIFTEEPLDIEIVPSRANLSLDEKIQQCSADGADAVQSTAANNISLRRVRRSSVRLSEPSLDEQIDDLASPKEVQEKTRFYYEKVDSELERLQGLCDLYAPFLEPEHELNDHCRGLIIAAQGQTNILIKKKLTKFRELIEHYEMKWNDRKVRHDDLDGFWVMLSLDLDNLNKRFDELRSLKENNWQELAPSPEPQAKTKKLRAGGGIRKREKKQPAAGTKASSSVIADLIRKARQEKQKQKTTVEDLEPLKETVTVVTTPEKRAVRFGKSPKRSSVQQRRSSICPGGTPIVSDWEQPSEPEELSKRRTIFPEITQQKTEDVKSILKTPKVKNGRRAKSVLFLDSGLDTPETRCRHTSRSIVDTPKPKIKFNDELEIEHIDNLATESKPVEDETIAGQANLTQEEKVQPCSVGEGDAIPKTSTSNTPLRRSRRNSVRITEPAVVEPNDDPAPPKEVQEKTRFYYEKVDNEVGRLQGLCDLYAPFLEPEHELNDHCRGLIIAAQGQTNILFKKKFTKFRELIGHYELKWNDRKVRHDDLDGFWVMLSLDLDNLNKRFDELRSLKENNWQEFAPSPEPQAKTKKLRAGGGIRKREKKQPAAGTKASSSVIADLIRKARQEKQKQKTTVDDLEQLKDTVTVVTTPEKRAVRFGKSPKRSSVQQRRSSLCPGGTPTVFHWEQPSKLEELSKRRTIFPDITLHRTEEVKSILKTPKVKNDRRAKSVLFLDSGLDTPQTRRRHTSRSIVDTPKPKIKFNDELEIEHIDNLAARTPSRLDMEIQKRLRHSQLLNASAVSVPASESNQQSDDSVDTDDAKQGRKVYARGTPRRSAASQRRSRQGRTSASVIADVFGEDSGDSKDCRNSFEGETDAAKRLTRSSANPRAKKLDYSKTEP